MLCVHVDRVTRQKETRVTFRDKATTRKNTKGKRTRFYAMIAYVDGFPRDHFIAKYLTAKFQGHFMSAIWEKRTVRHNRGTNVAVSINDDDELDANV